VADGLPRPDHRSPRSEPTLKEITRMTDHRDTVVVRDGGSNAGVIIAVIVLVLAIAIGWWLFLGPGAGAQGTSPGDIDVNIEVPSVMPEAS
jgi:hypothetical protein